MTSSVPSMQITGVSGRMNFMMCWMKSTGRARGYEDYDGWFAHTRITPGNWNACTRARKKQSESVALSTLHSAKGLKYENVYLIDMNEE